MSRLVLVLALAALATGCSRKESSGRAEEAARRDALARALSSDAGSSSAWNVSCSDEVIYADGFTLIQHDGSEGFRGRAFRWMGQRGTVRLKSHGSRPMRLFMYGWANVKALQTTPTLTAYIDGRIVGTTTPPSDTGLWGIDAIVPSGYLEGHDWVELTVTSSTIAWPWVDVPYVTVIAFNSLSWTEPP